jgi:hypothetical protein
MCRKSNAPLSAPSVAERQPASLMSVEGNPVRNRLLRLELLLVIIVVGAGCFMGQTLRQEHTFDDIRSSQSRMLSNISRMLSKNEREVKSVATSVSALTTALALSNSQIADLASELELSCLEHDFKRWNQSFAANHCQFRFHRSSLSLRSLEPGRIPQQKDPLPRVRISTPWTCRYQFPPALYCIETHRAR